MPFGWSAELGVSSASSWALGAISGSESASSEIPRHSTTAAPQHRSIATGHSASYPTTNNQQHLDLCAWFLHRQFPACQCSSFALPLFTFTSLIVDYSLRSFTAPLFVPRCLHHESSRELFANIVFLPRPLPRPQPHPRLRHTRSLHQRLRKPTQLY